ncbi:hypothetical protein B7463_g10637, partial [Scytalidium lignicola]
MMEHNFMSQATGKGALSLWTHNLKNPEVDLNYVSSTYRGPAMKIGAGVLWYEAEEMANRFGFVVVAGECPTVGIAGGSIQAGGHPN